MQRISKEDLMAYIEEGKKTPVIITEDGIERYALIDMHDYDVLMEAKDLMETPVFVLDGEPEDTPLYSSEAYQEACERFIDMFTKLFGPDTEKMN